MAENKFWLFFIFLVGDRERESACLSKSNISPVFLLIVKTDL